ncbi:hypothetical protein [Helicobacter sp. T3_23-1056]
MQRSECDRFYSNEDLGIFYDKKLVNSINLTDSQNALSQDNLSGFFLIIFVPRFYTNLVLDF